MTTPLAPETYIRAPEESNPDYINRILAAHKISPAKYRENDEFISLVVKNKQIFKLVVPQLSTRNIQGSQRNTSSLLETTLFTLEKVSQKRFLIKEMLTRKELDIVQLAVFIFTIKSHLEEKNDDKSRKIAGKHAKILEELDQLKLNENGICLALFFACHTFSLKKHHLMQELKKKGVPQLETEAMLANINEDRVDSLFFAENELTPEDLTGLIHLARLKPYFEKSSEPICLAIPHSSRTLKIYAGQTAFDVALQENKMNSLFRLLRYVEDIGNADLKQTTATWLELHPEVIMKRRMLSAEKLAHEVITSESLYQSLFNPTKMGDKSFIARHPNQKTKPQRTELKKTLRECIDRALNQASATEPEELKKPPKQKAFIYLKNGSGVLEKFQILRYPHPTILFASMDCFNYSTSIRLINANQEKIIGAPMSAIFNRTALTAALKGNRYEIVYGEDTDRHHPTTYWNDWEAVSHVIRDYDDLIHPAIADSVAQITSHLKKTSPKEEPLNILDVCGGTGRLAQRILSKLSQAVNYTILELNDIELQNARSNLKKQIAAVKTDVVEDENYFTDEDKKIPFQDNSIDIVVCSGALTSIVLKDKTAALTVLSKIHRYLKQGGFMVLSGHANSLLSSEDFEKQGFVVLNMTIPSHVKELYILKKT